MNRSILVCILFAAASALAAQQPSQASPYEGTSNPPPDDEIYTSTTPEAKPPAGHASAPVSQQGTRALAEPTSVDPSANFPDLDSDAGTVRTVAPRANASVHPALTARDDANDPDGDIVHPHTLRPGELQEGTTIRVRLLRRLSSASIKKGSDFCTVVANDVLQNDQVMIPAGAKIDGQVVEVSTGYVGGRGSMRLRPETIILPDGRHFRLHAETTSTPGSKTHVEGEGAITANSRFQRDGAEYSGAVGAGAVTGAILAGPVGAITGGAIGAGVVTAHLLVSHPQATLESGTTLLFMLTEPLLMEPARESGN